MAIHYSSLAKRVGNAVRLAEVVQVLVKHGFADIVRRAGIDDGVPAATLRRMRLMEAAEARPENVGERLRAVLIELGPTAIKFGQVLSTRPDMLRPDLCEALSFLQDKVTPLPFDRMKPIIETNFEGAISSKFDTFNEVPVAAASLSQVYKARLQTGQDVAVKVQRPGIREVIQSDLNLLEGLAAWMTDNVADVSFVNLPGMVEEFSRSIRRELDFGLEARVIERFQANFAGDERVFIPKVYRDCSGPQVLTMDWIDGVRIDALSHYEARESDPKVMAHVGSDVLCRQIFEYRFFHADPHPGNIMLTRKNTIAFLDYGMVGHIERSDVNAIAELLFAIVDRNAERCMYALLSFTVSGDTDSPETLLHDVGDFIAFDAHALVGRGQVGRLVDTLTAILRRNRLQLQPRFSLLLKALATTESTGRKLDPELDMIPILQPYVQRIVLHRYSPPALWQELQQNGPLFAKMARDMPGEVHTLTRNLRRGRFRMQLHHEQLPTVTASVERIGNRIALAVVAAALILGGSLLLTAGSGYEVFAIVSFGMAGLLGAVLGLGIWRTGAH